MCDEQPPPGGGTPLRGNRANIMMNENMELKRQLSQIQEILTELQQENQRLKHEITVINGNRFENLEMEEDFENNSEEQVQNVGGKKIITYETDEEELERETNWILKRSRKNRKRKESPKMVNDTSNNDTEKRDVVLPPPPVNIMNIHDFSVIREIMNDFHKDDYKLAAMNNDRFKINLKDEATYRKLTRKLNDSEVQWYTYENKNDRPIRVMLRGLHCSTPTSDIKEDLKMQNLDVIDVVNILKKPRVSENEEKTPLPLFMASFGNKESIDNIYNIRYILNTKVKVESLRKNNMIIPQCKRCQGFNHTQKYCAREPRCVSCAGKHLSVLCNVEKTKPAFCINCKGQHPANYRGCEIAKELQKIRIRNIKSKKNEPNNYQVGNKISEETIENHPPISHAPQSAGHKTYAQVCKNNKNNNENINNQDIMRAINQLNRRLDEQSFINEKIFDKLRAIEARL